MNDGQEGLGNLHVAPLRNGSMEIASLAKRRVTAPVVGDNGSAWRNDAMKPPNDLVLRSGTTASRTRPAYRPVRRLLRLPPCLRCLTSTAPATSTLS